METVNTPRPVKEFIDDAKPCFEGGVAFVLMRRPKCPAPARVGADAAVNDGNVPSPTLPR